MAVRLTAVASSGNRPQTEVMQYVRRVPDPPLDRFVDDIYCLLGMPRHRRLNVPPAEPAPGRFALLTSRQHSRCLTRVFSPLVTHLGPALGGAPDVRPGCDCAGAQLDKCPVGSIRDPLSMEMFSPRPCQIWSQPDRALSASDVELTELSVHVTLNLFSNYFNHLVKTDVDLPAAPGL
jgi:hypothetical protein